MPSVASVTEVSALAYTKIAFHAAKHPHATVLGLLLASTSSSNVVDALPLLHHWTTLSPMAEAGLAVAEQHVETRSLRLAGIYVVNAHLDDNTVGTVPLTLAKAVAARSGDQEPLVMVLDNRRLATGKEAFVSSSKQVFSLADASIPDKAQELIRQGRHRQLGDWDDHLEDINVRWLDVDVLSDSPSAS